MSAVFSVNVGRRAFRELADIPAHIRLRIQTKIDALALNAYPAGCKKLEGEEGAWRIRMGDYRVIYQVNKKTKMIDIRAVGHRREIYK